MKKIIKLLEKYSISESTPLKLIRESNDNYVYVIGCKNKKILRVSKKINTEDLRFEFDVLRHFSKNGFPVSIPIKAKNSNLYVFSENGKVAVLFNFLEGYHIGVNKEKENLATKEQAYTAGRALSTMAEIGKTFESSSIRCRNIFSELERVITNEKIFKRDFEGGGKFIKEVKQAIKFGKENKLPVGLIHNDYRAGNVFFKNDSEISGVIDFDWSCIGPLIKDLALGVLEWSYPDERTEPDFNIFDAFLDGYNSVSKEKYIKGRELYSWIMFAALSDTATFFCDRLNNPEQKKSINYSYMYHKYLFFSKLS